MRSCVKTLATLLVTLSVAPACSADGIETMQYDCERGARVTATYINTDGASFAVIAVEGQQIGMVISPSGSGAKYTQAPDGAGYVWWTKGGEAFLAWEDVPNSTDDMLLSDCVAR